MSLIDMARQFGIRGYEDHPNVKAMVASGFDKWLEEKMHRLTCPQYFLGRLEATRAMILRQGTVRFGKPTKRLLAKLDAVTDLVALEDLGVRLLGAANWKDLLTGPAAK